MIKQLSHMDILEWTKQSSFSDFSENMLDQVGSMESEDQALFLRKLVEMHRLQISALTPNILKRLQRQSIDLTLYIVLESVLLYKKSHRFLYNDELYNILHDIYKVNNKDNAFSLWNRVCQSSLLSLCQPIRVPWILKHPSYQEQEQFCFIAKIFPDFSSEFRIDTSKKIDNESFKKTIQDLKAYVPERQYDAERRVFLIPTEHYHKFIDFLLSGYGERCEFVLNMRENQKIETSDWTFLQQKPLNTVFCEGWKANKPHPHLRCAYHWCGGRARFHCTGICRQNEYQRYTLYDILSILSLEVNDRSLSYFYGKLNWFTIYLEHLFCKECGNLLEPSSSTAYRNAHRITYFECPNRKCTKHAEVIYLNHCFTEGCGGIIDSRESAKCPHGFVICNKCGICCGSEQFTNKGFPNGDRVSQILNKNKGKLHLDLQEYFCPKCGQLLQCALLHSRNSYPTQLYICNNLECDNYRIYGGVFPLTDKRFIGSNSYITKALLDLRDQATTKKYRLEIIKCNRKE